MAIAEKLCNDPLMVGLVGYMCSGGSKPASDIHNKYKVVMAAEGVLVVRQMKRVGLRKTIFLSCDGSYTEKDFIKAGGKATTGSFITYAKQPDPNWVKAFEEKYGPRQTFSPQACDGANILIRAVEKVAKKKSDGSLVIGKRALRNAVAETNQNI